MARILLTPYVAIDHPYKDVRLMYSEDEFEGISKFKRNKAIIEAIRNLDDVVIIDSKGQAPGTYCEIITEGKNDEEILEEMTKLVNSIKKVKKNKLKRNEKITKAEDLKGRTYYKPYPHTLAGCDSVMEADIMSNDFEETEASFTYDISGWDRSMNVFLYCVQYRFWKGISKPSSWRRIARFFFFEIYKIYIFATGLVLSCLGALASGSSNTGIGNNILNNTLQLVSIKRSYKAIGINKSYEEIWRDDKFQAGGDDGVIMGSKALCESLKTNNVYKSVGMQVQDVGVVNHDEMAPVFLQHMFVKNEGVPTKIRNNLNAIRKLVWQFAAGNTSEDYISKLYSYWINNYCNLEIVCFIIAIFTDMERYEEEDEDKIELYGKFPYKEIKTRGVSVEVIISYEEESQMIFGVTFEKMHDILDKYGDYSYISNGMARKCVGENVLDLNEMYKDYKDEYEEWNITKSLINRYMKATSIF